MSLRNFDQLVYDINQAVHTNGPLGKTTAPGLNAVLQGLAKEITTLPQVLGSAPGPAAAPQVVLAATLAELPATGQPDVLYVLTGGAATLSSVLYRWAGTAAQYVPVLPPAVAPYVPPGVQVRDAFGGSNPITFGQDTDFEELDGSPLTEGFDATGSAAAFSFAGAVRGTTVRVPYYSATPFKLPASFNLLTGPLPTDNVKTILYFRYVRDNVVDVTAGTSLPGTYLARFWAMPGVADVGLALYMGTDTQVLAVSSEGRKVRAGAYNGGGPGVHFDNTAGNRYVDLFAYAGNPVLGALAGNFAGIGPVYGELNLDVLPDLGGFCNMQFTRGYTKVIAHKPGMDLLIAYRYEGTLLDLSQCVVKTINAYSSYCGTIALPPANEYLTSLNLSEHRLYNKELIFPSLPNLAFLDLSTGQPYAGRIDRLDISQLPSLTSLYTQQASLRTLVIGDNALAHLTTVNFAQGRLTSRAEAFGQGNFEVVVQLAQRAHQLTSLNLGANGLSEAEIDQLLSALVAALPAAVAGPKTLNLTDPISLGEMLRDRGYPFPFNSDPNYGFAYNAPLVSAATRAKVAQLRAGGWQVTYNEQVPLYAEYVSATAFRGAYQGPAALDVWAVGDALTLQSSDGQHVPAGTYTVTGGSGHTWEFAAAEGSPALAPFEGGRWVALATPS